MGWTSVLGVSPAATPDQIKSAFRRLSAEHHPDKGGDVDRYREIVQAYADARAAAAKPRGAAPPKPRPRRGRTLFDAIELTVFESVTGGTFEVGGVRVKVPPGIQEGQRLRVAGRGEPGHHGGPAGDLLVEIRIQRDRQWLRDDPSLIHRLRVSWLEAYRGDAVTIRTPWGERTLTLQPGSSHGDRITCPGHGLEGGDLIVILELVAPLPGQAAVEAALETAEFPRR